MSLRAAFLAFALLAFPAAAQTTPPGGGVTPADRAAIASCVRESGEMPRACIGTIAVVCAREPGTAREGGDVACSRREAAVWRERLDLTLSAFAQRLEAGPRSRLVALQRTWESYAAQKCAFAAEIQPPARAASMQAGCELRETALRAIEIERMTRRQARPGDARPQLHR
jgi:hypothetical protein